MERRFKLAAVQTSTSNNETRFNNLHRRLCAVESELRRLRRACRDAVRKANFRVGFYARPCAGRARADRRLQPNRRLLGRSNKLSNNVHAVYVAFGSCVAWCRRGAGSETPEDKPRGAPLRA